MISKLDPRYGAHQFKRILRNAMDRNGISRSELIAALGMPQSTYYDHLRNGDFTKRELIKIFKIANFYDAEILEVMRA